MDNFDYKAYLKSGKIHTDSTVITESEQVSEKKKQGYDDREDESLGARKGAEKGKKQSMKDRRDDSYGKFGKRDAEKKGKNKINKESQEVDESLAMAAGVASIFGGAAAMTKIMDKLEKGDLGEKGKSLAKTLASLGNAASSVRKESEEVDEGYGKKYEEDDVKSMSEDARTDAEQEGYKDGFDDAKDDIEGALKKMKVSELKAKIRETILAELSLSEDSFQADEAGSQYHAGLYNEAEEDVDVDIEDDVEADVDVDVKDTVDVDAEGDDIEIEKPAVKAKVQVGLSPEETIVQDSLKAAMDAADVLGNDKLADQIGNTITFFTREYVVGRNSD